MQNRGSLFKGILWLAWLAAIIALAAEPFLWQVEYFKIHGAPLYLHAIVALLLLLIPACLIYVRLRTRGWYRYELQAISAGAIFLAVIEQPRACCIAVLFFVSCLAAGQRLVALLGIRLEGAPEVIGIGFLTGSAALIPVLFILGLLHAYYWPVFLALLVAPLALAWREALSGIRVIGAAWRNAGELAILQHPLCGIGVIFLGAAVLCGTLAALTPTIVMDAVKMHLPAAQAYLAAHALKPVPNLDYAYFPQGFEVLVTAAYSLGSQPAARLITPLFLIALLFVVYGIARLCAVDAAGILVGLAAILVTPFILWDGSQVKNDTELAVFQLGALYCCLRWRGTQRRSWLTLGAFLLAASFGIKHTAVFGAVPLVLLFLAPLYRRPQAIRTAAMFCLCLGVFGFYWHLRTYILTGDPFYPRQAREAVVPRVNYLGKNETWMHRRLIEIWRVQLDDNRIGLESPLRSPMGILPLLFAPLALLVARKADKNRKACWFYIGLYVLLWGSRMTTLRYALAPITLLIVLVAAKMKDAYEQRWAIVPRFMRFSVAAAFGGALAYGLLGVILVEIVPGQLPFLAHRISQADYLRANLPGYAALESFRRVNPHAAVILVNACARTYAPDPVDSDCEDAGPLRVQKVLNAHDFQYAVLPASWTSDARALLFSGWKADEVYKDRDWLGFRISRSP